MILFYNLFLFLYKNGIRFVGIWNSKARLWTSGRKDVFKKLKNARLSPDHKTVWMHFASLGEYEQGKPVVQKLQAESPGINIIITFFSPSGYEIIKKKNEFKHIFYLPMDSYLHARRWMKILKPDLVIWVKYEYWYYYLQEIQKKNIPLYLISGVYRPNQVFFKWYGGLYRKMLGYFTHFFLQNDSSKESLEKLIATQKISVTGDTRCDRVIQTRENFKPVPGIAEFCGDAQVVVAGSTWEADEAIWIHFVKENPQMKFILAPHEIDKQNLDKIKADFPGSVLYSEWSKEVTGVRYQVSVSASPNCLIIDNIGMLSRLYHYATIAYVGGGFGDNGLHNILEAAVFGKPVLYGPHHHKNFEAAELINTSGGISVGSAVELEAILEDLLKNVNEIISRGEAAKKYIFNNAGATGKIVEFIYKKGF